MKILTKEEISLQDNQFRHSILNGSIFVHPTDTIYGLGCNAMDGKAVNKLRSVKERPEDKPFSIIAPSKQWIKEFCEVPANAEEWLDKLPGPYTLLLKLKNKDLIPYEVNGGRESIGIRIPDHWISKWVEELNIPIITTSANRHGNDFMTSIDDMDPNIKSMIDFVIYEDEKKGQPSTLVNLAEELIESAKARKII